MTAWQIVDLTDSGATGRIWAEKGHILLDGTSVGHLKDVIAVIVREDTRLRIATCLYTAAAKAGVSVVYTDHFAKPLGIMMPSSTNSRVAARHRAQMDLSHPRRKRAWQAIIRAKVKNQAAVVSDPEVAAKLIDMAADVRSGDTTNREAQASRLHWQAVFGGPFRRDADGKDPVNGALNYGYTVLRGAAARAVTAAGLWPTAGIYHSSRDNAWCLVDDLMEPFRPAVDRVVARTDSFPDRSARQALVAVLEDKFDKTTLRVAIQESVETFALYIEEKVDSLPEPRMR